MADWKKWVMGWLRKEFRICSEQL